MKIGYLLFPCALAMLHEAPANPPASAGHGAPVIAVRSTNEIDFGTYPAWESRRAEFRLGNAGDGLLRITRVLKGCGCATATVDRTELAPGDEALLVVTIEPDSIYGAFHKHAIVMSTDPNNPRLKLGMKGKAVPLVDVSPSRTLNLGRIACNAAKAATFTLTANTESVRLGPVRKESNFPADVTLTRRPGTNTVYHLVAALQPAPEPGNWHLRMFVPVRATGNHKPISLHVHGRIGATLFATPSMLKMRSSDMPVQKRFRLHRVAAGDATMDSALIVWPEVPGVEFLGAAPDARGRIWITATFQPAFIADLARRGTRILAIGYPASTSARIICRHAR